VTLIYLAGPAAAAASFTDYIEFQHSDESADGLGNGSEAEESLLFPGGDSSHLLQEDKSFFRLLTDIWRVRFAVASAGGHSMTTLFMYNLSCPG